RTPAATIGPGPSTQAPSAAGGAPVEPPADDRTLSVVTDPPGAHVHVDGVTVGASPVEVSVAPGRHMIWAARDGYVGVKYRVDIDERRVEIRLALKRLPRPATGRLDLRTTPLAHVSLDGGPAGDTPLIVDLPVGWHDVDIRWDSGNHSHARAKI